MSDLLDIQTPFSVSTQRRARTQPAGTGQLMTYGLSSICTTRTSPVTDTTCSVGPYVRSRSDRETYADRGTPSPAAAGACFVAALCMMENAATKFDR